jgi:hypothetical protein
MKAARLHCERSYGHLLYQQDHVLSSFASKRGARVPDYELSVLFCMYSIDMFRLDPLTKSLSLTTAYVLPLPAAQCPEHSQWQSSLWHPPLQQRPRPPF